MKIRPAHLFIWELKRSVVLISRSISCVPCELGEISGGNFGKMGLALAANRQK